MFSNELFMSQLKSFSFQVSKERFIKLEFEKFAVGNQSEECLHDYLEVDQDR